MIVPLLFAACTDDPGEGAIVLDALADLDGTVDSAGGVDASGDEMEIGRNDSGLGVRGFVTFDIADLRPAEGEVVVVEDAVLSVYENNFNLLPWDEMGRALLEIVVYDDLDAAAFDAPAIGGFVVASTDSDFLDFHLIEVDEAVQRIFDEDPSDGQAQFRIRFEDDSDTTDPTLDDHHWDLNTAEATEPADSGPTLTLELRYE